MIIKNLKKVSYKNLKEIKQLYIEAGWWKKYDNYKRLKSIIKGSYLFVVALENNKIIGMGRVISDGANDAYIQDFTVLKKHRNKGIGKKILRFILKILIKKRFKWIGLISEKKVYKFYKKCGFKIYRNKIPMIYEF